MNKICFYKKLVRVKAPADPQAWLDIDRKGEKTLEKRQQIRTGVY